MTQPAAFQKGARTVRPSNNPAKNDDIVSRWNGAVNKRYNRLKKKVTVLVGEQNAFGLVAGDVSNAVAQFSRGQNRTRVRNFMVWLREQEALANIDIIDRGKWTDPLITQNFARGAQVASIESNLLVPSVPILGRAGSGLVDFVNQPMSVDRIRSAQTATRNGMRGITVAMNNSISDVVARGLLSGEGATQMARNINDRISKIGMTRARLIARTESNLAYNQGAIVEFDNVSGIIGETVLVQWWATLDDRVRASHLARHGKIFTAADAQLLIGEPNCRCSLLPYIQSVEGKAKLSKADTFISNAVMPKRWGKGFEWDTILKNAKEGVCC